MNKQTCQILIDTARLFILACFVIVPLSALPGRAYAQNSSSEICSGTDTNCLLSTLIETTGAISNNSWRDKTYREIAKALASGGNHVRALTLLDNISSPDTKALTIRGIGMAAAENNLSTGEYDKLFNRLREEAEKINQKASYAIALTYIAMAQALAGDYDGAAQTAADMENDALRNKAYAETAEIQAEKGDIDHALKSIETIESLSFRDKSYRTVSEILADEGKYDDALKAAHKIDNAYHKAQSILYILVKQITPDEVSIVK